MSQTMRGQTRRHPSTKLCMRIYQESEEDIYITRKAMMLGVQIYVDPSIILCVVDVALDSVVILVPHGVSRL